MCEYCKPVDENKDLLNLQVWLDGGDLYVDELSKRIPINYCPMCGRKLREVE